MPCAEGFARHGCLFGFLHTEVLGGDTELSAQAGYVSSGEPISVADVGKRGKSSFITPEVTNSSLPPPGRSTVICRLLKS